MKLVHMAATASLFETMNMNDICSFVYCVQIVNCCNKSVMWVTRMKFNVKWRNCTVTKHFWVAKLFTLYNNCTEMKYDNLKLCLLTAMTAIKQMIIANKRIITDDINLNCRFLHETRSPNICGTSTRCDTFVN